MSFPAKRLTPIDISTLETIYADGRAMGRLLQDFKDDLSKARTENATLRTEVRTLKYRLKAVTHLYEKSISRPKRKTTAMHAAAH